jgi:dolichol-phosphate mannosyltransferase
MPTPLVTLIVPCYNEVDGLPQLLSRLDTMRATGSMARWEVLFVNDGSQDATGTILNQMMDRYDWIRVVHHGKNRGLGAAVRTGFQHADSPYICTMDSDCTFAPETLPGMVEMLQAGADLVTASPWHPESEKATCHPVRGFLSRSASHLYTLILGNTVHSYTPMHRAYRRSVVRRIQFKSNGFSAIAEIMVKALLQGFRVKEVPMPVAKRQFGESKIKIMDSIMGHLALMKMASSAAFTGWAKQRFAWGRLAVDE